MFDHAIEREEGGIVMYRPTGPAEHALVADSGFARWPPRLVGQPIFYPVTNAQYAREITRQWNVRDDGAGYVFRFVVRSDFAERYEVQKVGGDHHTEWWIPAEDLEDLNKNIIGTIDEIESYGAGR